MMMPFQRAGDFLSAQLQASDATALSSMVERVVAILGGTEPAPEGEDPFELWAAEFGAGVPLDRSDPFIARFFPDASPDAGVAEEHRRLSQESQRRDWVDEAERVIAALAPLRRSGGQLVIPLGEVEVWLRVLNAVRLAVAAYLGITAADDYETLSVLRRDDPRRHQLGLLDQLGLILEWLLEAVDG